MTGGTFVLFEAEKVYATNEFNGDMYYEGHGKIVAMAMTSIRTKEDLLKFAKDFNKKEFGYPDEKIRPFELTADHSYSDCLNMVQEYFKKYFSDYLYIVNASGRDLEFTTKDGTRILPDNTSGVLNFGHDAKDFPAALNAFKGEGETGEADIIEEAARLFNVQLSAEETSEAGEILREHGYKTISGIWQNMREYAEEEVRDFAESWIIQYFDFEKYIQDHCQDLEFKGVYTLKSGKVLSFI